MSMVGADAAALDAAAVQMRKAADELDEHSGSLARSLGGLSWLGQVASVFTNMWNSHHKPQLASTAHFIRDAADKLNTQAKQQRDASGVSGASPSGAAPVQPPAAVQPPTAVAGGPLPGTDRTAAEVQRDYEGNYAKYHGLWADSGPQGANRYQCVSWAWFRMKELGFPGDQQKGNGLDIARLVGGTTSTIPKPGAVMSYVADPVNNANGHVVIAEAVTQGVDGRLSVRVSEMNVHGGGTPSEYSSTRIITQNADGTWASYGQNVSVTIANPAYHH